MSELLSYNNILKDIKRFKRSGTADGDDFNIYDTPAHKYFKILFYFGSNSEFGGDDNVSGLLAPTWEVFNKYQTLLNSSKNLINGDAASPNEVNNALDIIDGIASGNKLQYFNYNSAWAYLKLNDENERAEKLEQFVTLLSDINTNSPWYFSKVSGISDAIERKVTEDGKLEMTDKKLTITCLPDAFDNRITTLLDLYRDITWSWVHKKEIIPANLRKFDMAIYIFETPEQNWHVANTGLLQRDTIIDNTSETQGISGLSPAFRPSYKMLEFHDCEFNYNSIKSGWSELDNQGGVSPTYTIDISFADCYEISYNDIMMRKIGDVILTDLVNGSTNNNDYISYSQNDIESQKSQLKGKTYPYTHGFVETAVGEVVGHVTSMATDWVKQKIMGNIFGFSLTSLAKDAQSLLQGDIIRTGMTIGQFAREQKNKKDHKNRGKAVGNIFSSNTIANNL